MVPDGCVLISDTNIEYVKPGADVSGVYLCPNAKKHLNIDQEGLIKLGLVKTGQHSVGWEEDPGSGQYKLVVRSHEPHLVEKSTISYIHPGKGVAITWFTGNTFDGVSRRCAAAGGGSFHPDLTQTSGGIGNDNVHSVIVEPDGITSIAARPEECDVYSSLRSALL